MGEDRDAAYLQGVLEAWRGAFADAQGGHMRELYAAGARRASVDDWTHLRPLLRVLEVMLLSTSTFADQIGHGLAGSSQPSADAQTAQELHDLAGALREAATPLRAVLRATNPDPGADEGPGAGRPRRPTRVIDPAQGGLRGLLDIPVVVGLGVMIGVADGARAAVGASRAWWRRNWDEPG